MMTGRWQRCMILGLAAALTAGLGSACDMLTVQRDTSDTMPHTGQSHPSGATHNYTLPELASLPRPSSTGAMLNASQPLRDSDGQPLSSGLARFADGQAELMSRQGDENNLEWVAYGLAGLDPSQQPSSLRITLSKVDGTVQLGVSDSAANLWHWKYLTAPGVHELPLAGITSVSPSGTCYLVLGVSGGSSAVFGGAVFNGVKEGAPPAPEVEVTETLAQSPAATTAPARGEFSPAALTTDTKPASAEIATHQASETTVAQESENAAKPAATTGQPAQTTPAVAQDTVKPARMQVAGDDEKPAVVGTNKLLVIPQNSPGLHPYELPAQYRRLSGVVSPTIPAEDSAGWPLSSGMARIGSESMHLTSIHGDSRQLEWVVFGGSGFSPQTPPAQLTLSFDRIDGGVWIGLPNYTANSFDWTPVENAGPHAISLESKNVVRQDGELYFALGVTGGNYAEFNGGFIEEGTGVDLLGVYLSHGYWEADKIDAIFGELQDLGVNLVVDYALRWPSDAEWRDEFNSYMLSAQRHGIGIAYCLFPALAGATPENAEAQVNQALDEVYLLRNNPAITAWYVHDEVLPMVAGEGGTEQYTLSLKQMQDLYTDIHEADPGRPQINTWTRIPTRKVFNELFSENNLPFGREMWMDRDTTYEQTMQALVRTTCDWVFVDDYPLGAPWAIGANPVSIVEATVARVAALRSNTQPLYFVFQSFSHAQYGRGGIADAPFPTSEEMQEMLFASRLHGAQGAIAYSWFDLTRTDLPGRDVPGRTKCLADLRQVLKEMDVTGWPVPEPAKTVADGE